MYTMYPCVRFLFYCWLVVFIFITYLLICDCTDLELQFLPTVSKMSQD